MMVNIMQFIYFVNKTNNHLNHVQIKLMLADVRCDLRCYDALVVAYSLSKITGTGLVEVVDDVVSVSGIQ